jgi:1-deoxy-D-xylulose-5-phosphate reductoisomerase
MKHISILGSTGSIGTQTLEVVENNKDMKVVALAAGSNIDLVEQQIKKFHPELVCIYDERKARELAGRLSHENVSVLYGMEGLIACATLSSADVVVAAVVGMIGIRPVMEAIRHGKDIAFANKETLVTAGHIIMPMIREHQVLLMPVDSEHAAIFQCLNGEHSGEVSRILLTASGGPFRGRTRQELESVTVEDALKHPNWSMGKKITIDSSTMVNKGLEVMEARWLFGVDYDKIKVVIQPQSVIHSMVEFVDGAVMAQLGTPDMKLPIQYALTYPERRNLPGERLDFAALAGITFEEPDLDTFPGLALAYEAGRAGGSLPTVYNAANEKAVSLFLNRKIGYLDIPKIIQDCMDGHCNISNPSLEDILQVEKEVHGKIDRKYMPI